MGRSNACGSRCKPNSSFWRAIRRWSRCWDREAAPLAEGQGLGQVRDDLDPHLAAAQALILMVGYLSLEAVVAASARPLGADEPALRERWREAAVELVVGGVSAR